jgi:hypothetical protein
MFVSYIDQRAISGSENGGLVRRTGVRKVKSECMMGRITIDKEPKQ